MTEAPVILRFPATGFVVILIYLFAPYVSSNPTQDIGFRAVDDTLGIGSACKFSGNNSMGICVELTLCQGADVDFHVHRISPTTCSFINNKFPIVCCLGANDFRATSPTLPSLPVQPVVPVLPTPTTGLEHNLERKSAAYCLKTYGKEKVGFYSIAGGNRTAPGEFPHMTALGWQYDGITQWKCGGSLISEKYVLTAAHCTDSNGVKPNIVRIGDENLNGVNPQTTFEIDAIIMHPDYRPPNYYNDIALMRLRTNVEINDMTRPACLWQADTDASTSYQVIGYGAIAFGGPTDDLHLLKTFLEIAPAKRCMESYPKDDNLPNGIHNHSQICAGDSSGIRDTCQGDSGGPLQRNEFRDKRTYFIVGVTSFGRACATATPAIYTRITTYLDWIESIVWPV